MSYTMTFAISSYDTFNIEPKSHLWSWLGLKDHNLNLVSLNSETIQQTIHFRVYPIPKLKLCIITSTQRTPILTSQVLWIKLSVMMKHVSFGNNCQ